jgi:hypothetical protein
MPLSALLACGRLREDEEKKKRKVPSAFECDEDLNKIYLEH